MARPAPPRGEAPWRPALYILLALAVLGSHAAAEELTGGQRRLASGPGVNAAAGAAPLIRVELTGSLDTIITVTVTPPANTAVTGYRIEGVPVGQPAGTPTIFATGMGFAVAGSNARFFNFAPGIPTLALRYKSGMGYRFKASAFTRRGQSAFSALTRAVTPQPLAKPCTPEVPTVSASGNTILVQIRFSDFNLRSSCAGGISSYKVVGTPGNIVTGRTITAVGLGSNPRVPTLTFAPGNPINPGRFLLTCPASTYKFSVLATNSRGDSRTTLPTALVAAPTACKSPPPTPPRPSPPPPRPPPKPKSPPPPPRPPPSPRSPPPPPSPPVCRENSRNCKLGDAIPCCSGCCANDVCSLAGRCQSPPPSPPKPPPPPPAPSPPPPSPPPPPPQGCKEEADTCAPGDATPCCGCCTSGKCTACPSPPPPPYPPPPPTCKANTRPCKADDVIKCCSGCCRVSISECAASTHCGTPPPSPPPPPPKPSPPPPLPPSPPSPPPPPPSPPTPPLPPPPPKTCALNKETCFPGNIGIGNVQLLPCCSGCCTVTNVITAEFECTSCPSPPPPPALCLGVTQACGTPGAKPCCSGFECKLLNPFDPSFGSTCQADFK